ncbi:MAG: DUF2079 domain-containing protein [Actinobacteria bacterium]|nr:DUF2079 domain-containing protein [Actinomycetota bacterium]
MRLINVFWGRFGAFRARHPRFSTWISRYGIFLLVLFFILLYSMISLLKHMNFQSHGWDLGIFDQHVWQLSHCEFGFNTVRMVPSLWGDHFHPIFFFVVPAYWIWSDARMLLIYQAVVVALGAIPIYYVVRRNFKSGSCALMMALTYLIFWGTMELIFFDFHTEAFLGPLLALSYFFIDRDNWVGYLLTIPLLLWVKETTALLVFFLGLYVIIFRRKWFVGSATCVISLGWFFAVTKWIMPPLAAGTDYYYFKYYSHLGDDWGDVIKYLVTHPHMAVKELFVPYHKAKLLLFILLPFLFLPLIGGFAIVAIPALLERLLSNYYPHWEILRHYNAIFAPIFIFALLDAVPRLHRWLGKRGREIDYRKFVFAICVLILLVNVPFTFARSAKTLFNPYFYMLDPQMEQMGYDIISMIPPDASVCAQDPVVPHMSQREHIYQFDGDTYGAEYVVLNKFLDCYPFTNRVLVWEIARLYRDPRYEAHRFGYGWVVFTIKPEYDIEGKLEPFPTQESALHDQYDPSTMRLKPPLCGCVEC